MQMLMHMSAHKTLRSLGVDTQCKTATARLLRIALARHATRSLVDGRAANQLITTETLSAVLSACETEAFSFAVGNTFGSGDLLDADVSEFNAGENPIGLVILLVCEAPVVRPARDIRGTG